MVQVEAIRRCHYLMELVLQRSKVMKDLDKAVAVLQRTATLYPEMDEELELDVLDARYDLNLLNQAIRMEQAAHGNNDMVGGRAGARCR